MFADGEAYTGGEQAGFFGLGKAAAGAALLCGAGYVWFVCGTTTTATQAAGAAAPTAGTRTFCNGHELASAAVEDDAVGLGVHG